MEIGHRAHAAVPPHREANVRNRTRHLLDRKAGTHRAADLVETVRHARVDVRIQRIRVGRDDDPRVAWRTLVLVVDDLRVPLVIDHFRDGLRLRHVVHEEVTVVIVADIVVIELRWRGLLVRCIELALVPLADDLQPVRVHAGHQQEDDVLPDRVHLRRLFRRDAMRELWRHLRMRHFGRVQPGVDPDDRLAFHGQGLGCLFVDPCPGELLADGAVSIEIRMVFRRRNCEQVQRSVQRRAADLTQRHTIAVGGQLPVVGLHLRITGELVVVAGLETEHVSG